MDRRAFLSWVGVGWLASCLPVAIAACSSRTAESDQKSQKPAEPPRADGYRAVGAVADLDKTGQLLAKDFPAGAVLVVRNPANPKAVFAVSPTCTHQGCIVEWKADQKAFVCPCHGSKFSPNGQLLAAPATRPLRSFSAKIQGNSVLVKA
ncbi:MAG: Rieske 2Fe-2S domain-containing protein [Leptolyngbyaceae cyanobacterium RU_5_1]|nr:Rieske 2Fe-2S domain-containing protein [Leptolyngbyaceae cyanobacterium RU_5_1]